MADQHDFQAVFSHVAEAQEADGGFLLSKMEDLRQESESISQLMQAMQDLAEPEPQFFTRG